MTRDFDRLDYIASANQAFVAIESLDVLLPEILRVAEKATSADASSYLRFNSEDNTLVFEVMRTAGVPQDVLAQLNGCDRISMDSGIAGKVARSGKSMLVHDVSAATEFSSDVDDNTGYQTRSILCVPVMYHRELMGVIQVLNPTNKLQFDDDDIKILELFASLSAASIARAKYLEARIRQSEMEAELSIAAKIQAHCWPVIPEMPPGMHVWGKSIAAKAVGGDLYDCISLSDGSYLLYVADVSGKGLPAGLIMIALWSSIRSEAASGTDLAALLKRVNSSTFNFLSGESFFATIGLLRYWPATRRLQFASGGHGAPLYHDGTGFVELQKPNGLPFGVLVEQDFQIVEIELAENGYVLLYSDGLTEAFCPAGEMFGLERAKQALAEVSGRERGRHLVKRLLQWTRQPQSTDDMTLLDLFVTAG